MESEAYKNAIKNLESYIYNTEKARQIADKSRSTDYLNTLKTKEAKKVSKDIFTTFYNTFDSKIKQYEKIMNTLKNKQKMKELVEKAKKK